MESRVQFLKESVIRIDDDVIQSMKKKASQNELGKFRYCFHENEDAEMQEMLFVVSDHGYARPHMHKEAAESHVIVDGVGECVLFDNLGNIIEHFEVSKVSNFIYRIQKAIWHMVIPISRQLVIYEVREGNFDKKTNIFPDWAPIEGEKEQAEEYKQKLISELRLKNKAYGGKG